MEKTTAYAMHELTKESRMGARGSEAAREVRIIDLTDFEQRKHDIADQLWQAATDIGFFQVSGHGIPLDDINAAFANAERFFALPESEKAHYPLSRNAGWEYRAQIRPSTGKPDHKESYQITLPRMAGLWPNDSTLPDFRAEVMQFERQCWTVGMQLLSCFALKLGFPEDFFTHAHEPSHQTYQSTLRMLHYFAITGEVDGPWRAGAHTDFDCLTLLFQRDGQGGLQVCPGKEMEDQVWTPITPLEGVITCNIGDMLMRWSDDKLPSNFHRVANPLPGVSVPARYSLAFFCQANEDVIIEGPEKKYPPISAQDYLAQRISANFSGKY
jgi:isopenicillin N synthase-like dioxygenase